MVFKREAQLAVGRGESLARRIGIDLQSRRDDGRF
jgi:hypothetical protein